MLLYGDKPARMLTNEGPPSGPVATIQTEVRTLDSYQLREVDLLVLDVEGQEAYALFGAIDTITRCRPVIHVEERKENFAKMQEAINKYNEAKAAKNSQPSA